MTGKELMKRRIFGIGFGCTRRYDYKKSLSFRAESIFFA